MPDRLRETSRSFHIKWHVCPHLLTLTDTEERTQPTDHLAMSYRTYDVNPSQSGSSSQPSRNPYGPLGQPSGVRYVSSDQPASVRHAPSGQPARTLRYVSSNQPSRTTYSPQPQQVTRVIDRRDGRSASPRRGIDRRRSSGSVPLVFLRQRRISAITDDLPVRYRLDHPNTAQNIYHQDRIFEHSSGCRRADGRFYCHCGYNTARQVEIINHAARVHRAPTPYVCPVCGVHCPRGLYQYNDHLQTYHPGIVQHAALQYRNDRFVRRDGSYYN